MHIVLLYIMLQIYSVEHPYGLDGESLRETFTICIYASLDYCSQFVNSGDSTMQSYNE